MDPNEIVIETLAQSDRDGQSLLNVQHFGSSLVYDEPHCELSPEFEGFRRAEDMKNQSVQTITLDSYLEDTGEIVDLIKVDVQGYEHAVLRGAKRSIDQGMIRR